MARRTGINLRQLRYFVKVVELGNMTRAAEAMHVAQPALGLQVRQLEESLAVELLIRHSRGVSPTPAGDLLFKRAQDILRAVEDAQEAVRALAGNEAETIVLGLTPSVMRLLGPGLMMRAKDELPHVTLTLVEDLSFELLEAMERQTVDVALAYEAEERPGLVREAVLEEELLFVTAPGHGGAASTITFAEAIEQPLTLAGRKDAIWKLASAAAARLSLPLNIVYEAQSIAGMRELVRLGAAASILPYGTLLRDLQYNALQTRRIVEPPLKRTLFVVRSAKLAATHRTAAFDLFVARLVQDLLEKLGDLAVPVGCARPLERELAFSPLASPHPCGEGEGWGSSPPASSSKGWQEPPPLPLPTRGEGIQMASVLGRRSARTKTLRLPDRY